MSPIIPMISADITGILTYVSGLFEDFNVVILFCIGLPLAFWVIRKTITLVRAR
jgi:hypothetical protein